jgi:hypothetical protein
LRKANEVGNDILETVWDYLYLQNGDAYNYPAELSALLKVMVMLEDAPATFIARLLPQHAELCRQGRQLRAQLPSYLGQQRATIVADCTLPGVLQSLVIGYAAITPEDMWADGLRVKAPKAKRARAVLPVGNVGSHA